MRCKYCGENIEKEYIYCINCGKPTGNDIEDYLEEENKTNEEIEYFEIETEKQEDKQYDFTEFLKNDEKEDEKIEHDNLEDTKKRVLFERSDFKVFDKFRNNKERIIIDKQNGEQYVNGAKYNREYKKETSNYKQDKFGDSENIKLEKAKAKLKRKKLGKQIRNIFYNIIVLILAGILSLYLQVEFTRLLNNTGISFFFYLGDYMIIIGAFLLIIFLLAPFFTCKGNAKIPLLFFSILISWTIIGWIILFVVSLTSNNKWKIRMLE